MKKIIIFLGVPGSGKGTQAKQIAAVYNYEHISTGDLLRALEADPLADADDKQRLVDMKAGRLVADELIYRLAWQKIKASLASGKGVVLDGAIRSVDQAKAYQAFFAEQGWADEVVVIEIALTDAASFERLSKRKVCSACGHIIPYSPDNADKMVCEKCGGELITREDDNPATMQKRIQEQGNASLRPISRYYELIGLLHRVDGMKSIVMVAKEIDYVLHQNT